MSNLTPTLADMLRLAARIASNCPGDGECLIQRLSAQNVSAAHIAEIIFIAREIRDRAHERTQSLADERADARMNQLFGIIPGQPVAGAACCGGSACCN